MELRLLDIMLSVLHLLIIGFNLLGWIWKPLLRAHLICVSLTAASWLLLGIWFGIGYCPITDWQWRVKERLGEENLPGSFITYFAERISGRQFSDSLVNTMTALVFALVAALSVYLNFFRRASR